MFENIPNELKQLNQWVVVKSDSKAPLDANTGFGASSVKAETWSDYDTALSCIEQGYVDNLGFVFASNGLVGIDIDTGYDEDGFPSPVAVDIIKTCKSYTEKSRSGRGFHILVKGKLPFKGRNNLAGLEIYQEARYFIMTGNTTLYKDIVDNQEAIDYIVSKYFPEQGRTGKSRYNEKIYTPKWVEPVKDGRVKLRPVYEPIKKGCRNISLLSVAGTLHTLGYSKKAIYNELQRVNKEACEPPLDNREIQTICNSIVKYRR